MPVLRSQTTNQGQRSPKARCLPKCHYKQRKSKTRSTRKNSASPERLSLPVGEAAPKPFGRPEQEEAEPNRADHQLRGPNAEHHEIKLVSVKRAKQPEAITVEERRTNQRGSQIIGERHAAYGRQTKCETRENPRPHDEHYQANVSQSDGQSAGIVRGRDPGDVRWGRTRGYRPSRRQRRAEAGRGLNRRQQASHRASLTGQPK